MQGFTVSGRCYPSASDALSAMAGHIYGAGPDGVSYYTTVSGPDLITHYSTGVLLTTSPSLEQCYLVGAHDSFLISGAILVAWAATYSVCVLRRALHADNNS